MLYERWRQIARDHRHEPALLEIGSSRQWTFGQLAQAAEAAPASELPIQYPQGATPEFIFQVLAAWRRGQPVLPLELGQKPFAVAGLPPAIVHLKTTSATTGAARVIAFTASQLMADAENIVQTMGLRADWPNLGVISLAHSYGFSNLILPLLLHGIPLLLLDSPLPEAIRKASSNSPNITLAAVPALWRAWHEAGAICQNVRLAISAGAPLPLPLEQEIFEANGIKLHNFYGATECGGIAYDPTDSPRTDPACVGRPLRNVRVSAAEKGCLEVRSDAVAETYWPEPDPNLGRGYYRTSDLAHLEGGQIFLRGRSSEQINVAGRKISPEEIEQSLLQHALVRECLVFGAPSPDEGRAETIVACVAVQAPISQETLKEFLLARLPAWQVPRVWYLVESLSPNQRGKLSRAQWRERYLRDKQGDIRS